ncbi:cytidine deaminase-like protein [Emericellopsis atlantica]|uniref:Cytidine deaminase-like protein n=1 Tax=Emericellopsis atlantica TaxID=2614577 RepID=A0A9P7ZQT4_9HYPO|nr:cytidine deaminase-like protein [Emericellopsis atlantica]KAG9256406.1 cytidine deaminase-like protein [Emericellopsis atlantica]
MATEAAAVGKENQDPNSLVHAKGQLGNGPSDQIVADGFKDGEPEDTAPPEPPKDPKLRRRVLPNPITDALSPQHLKQGVLIPLKTTQEVRQDHTIVQALITRAPTKSANVVLEALRSMHGESKANNLTHLRRCAKPTDLPAHLKTQFMNDSPAGRQIHTAKSNWIYIIVGEVKEFSRDELVKALAHVEGIEEELFLAAIPIPLLAPTSQIQAAMWSAQFWPTVYRKNNPLGPHPSVFARGSDEIKDSASLWMALAHQVAEQGRAAGIGEAIGCVIVQRDDEGSSLVALAADARWHQEPNGLSDAGLPMTHAVLRAMSMVAQKLVRHERKGNGLPLNIPNLEYDAFQDQPLIPLERACYEQEHPNKDGYLCHALEMYITHEPCVQCSMGLLHSRMGKVVFGKHIAGTGGLSSDDRPDGGGRGLGLFWRRELNWSLLAWEWEGDSLPELPPISPTTHV